MNNWFNHKQLLAVLLGIICGVPSITTVSAMVNTVEKNEVTVSFADLDLSKQAGVETLYGRLRIAARHACGSSYGYRNISRQQLTRKCYTEALSSAVQSVNDTKLSALHTR